MSADVLSKFGQRISTTVSSADFLRKEAFLIAVFVEEVFSTIGHCELRMYVSLRMTLYQWLHLILCGACIYIF